jgi:outer membrane protein
MNLAFTRSLPALGLLTALLVPGVAAAQTRVLSLSQAVAAAVANQPSLRQARAGTDAAAGRVEQARSGYFPQALASIAYQRTTANFTPRPSTTTTLQVPLTTSAATFDFYNASASATQLIYDFGQTSGRAKAAEANQEAASASEQTTRLQLVFAVQRVYFQARAQGELVRVARDTLANQDRHLQQIGGFVRAGMRPDIDLARARTDVANARVLLINAENGVALAKAQLAQLMGTPSPGPYELADESIEPVAGEDGPAEALVATALGSRPELLSLSRSRRAQEAALGGLRGAYWPTLAAVGSGTVAGTSFDRLVPNWAIGATLTWPFFQGGFTRGQIHEASATLAGIDAQTDVAKLQVRVDVEQAQLLVRGAKEAGLAAKEAELGAAEQLRLAEGRYAAGLGNAIELSDAQVAYTNAAAQSVQARYSLASARAQLAAALGTR